MDPCIDCESGCTGDVVRPPHPKPLNLEITLRLLGESAIISRSSLTKSKWARMLLSIEYRIVMELCFRPINNIRSGWLRSV
ncbi:hypothetical protein GBA52_016269 [Prunus armeniaca]|nr:hypothetical protein GBA52_016269 [Prunus armeniaca]